MTFGLKIRQLRDGMGLSERRLAEKSGVPFGTLHKYERGDRKPTLAAAAKLAAALGVDCTAFSDCDDVAGDGVAAKPRRPPAKGKAKRPTK